MRKPKLIFIFIVLFVSGSSLLLMLLHNCDEDVYIIWDCHDNEYESIYFFKGNKIYARKSMYPGYFKKIYYRTDNISDEIKILRDKIIKYKSQKREYIYPGPVFATIHVHNNKSQLTPLDDDSDEIINDYVTLHNLIIDPRNQNENIPSWIGENPVLREWLQQHRIQKYMLGIDTPDTLLR